MARLTAREVQVLELVAKGVKQREIAAQLDITKSGVTSCLARIAAKYGFDNVRTAQLINLAIQDGHLKASSLIYDNVLTARQVLILRLIAEGDSDELIAAKQGLAKKTIKHETSRILKKLKAKNRYHATSLARQLGLLP